jgi:hypothetical protein
MPRGMNRPIIMFPKAASSSQNYMRNPCEVNSFLSLRVHRVQKTGELSQNCTSTFVEKIQFRQASRTSPFVVNFEQTSIVASASFLHNFGALQHVPIKTVSRMILLMTFALHYTFLQQADVYSRCMRVVLC